MAATASNLLRLDVAPMHRIARGVSLVELLVGLAIGLLIVAAGAVFVSASLREQRQLMLEGRLTQDLRAAADLIARELRRSGYWAAASSGIWTPGADGVLANPYAALTLTAGAADSVSFRYSRDAVENHAVDSNEQFGFRLRNGAVEMQIGADNWQALTDSTLLTVSRFSITPTTEQISLPSACTKPCPAGAATCPPRLQVRSLALAISARSASDARVVRAAQSSVRLRNNALIGACAG